MWWQWLCKEIKYQLFALEKKSTCLFFTQQAQITCQTHFSEGSVILYFCFLASLHCFLVIPWICKVAYRYQKRWSKEGSRAFTHKAPGSSLYTTLLHILLLFVNMLVYFYFLLVYFQRKCRLSLYQVVHIPLSECIWYRKCFFFHQSVKLPTIFRLHLDVAVSWMFATNV